MAKKSSSGNIDPTRQKAQAMREAQAKADKRTRNIIIAVVSVIIVAIVAALIYVVVTQNNKGAGAPGQSGNSAMVGAIPAQFSKGEPIVVSHLGVGQRDENLKDLTLNFSYTCHWCTYLETRVGEKLTNDANDAKYNLILQPVNTAYMEFQGPATNAALIVAAQAPSNFVAFHQSMMQFAEQAINVDKDPTIITDVSASAAKVAELAKAAGVPDDVIAQFGNDATDYLTIANKNWTGAKVEGRDPENLGTPELIFDGTQVPWGQGTGEEIYAQIMESMNGLGLKNQ